MITFGVYGGFFLAYAATLQPSFNAFLGFDTNPQLAPVSPGFLASFGESSYVFVNDFPYEATWKF